MNGAVTRYVYDGEDILLEYDGLENLLARYSHGQRTDQPLAVARDLDSSGTFEAGEQFYYQADHRGSLRKITDSTGLVANSYDYDSYGNIEASFEGIANPFTYTGREFDAESGLYFYRARYYDPATGRFINQDPIGFAAGDLNLYRYVFNNPVNLTDPDGQFAIVLPLIPYILPAIEAAAIYAAGRLAIDSLPKGQQRNEDETADDSAGEGSGADEGAGANDEASGEDCPPGSGGNGEDGDGDSDGNDKPDTGKPGSARNPDGTPKSAVEQLDQLKDAQIKKKKLIDSTVKSEQRVKKFLKDLLGDF